MVKKGVLDDDGDNDNVGAMILDLNANGHLPPGIQWARWDELTERFGNESMETAPVRRDWERCWRT